MPRWARDDVKLSIRRYLALCLGQPWRLRLERREVRDDERPVGVLETAAAIPVRNSGRAAIPSGHVTRQMPVTVTLYPAVTITPQGEEERDVTPREASRAAEDLSQLMLDLIDIGLDLGLNDAGRPRAGPERVPLWDYAEVANEGADRAGPDEPYDHLWVGSHSSRPIQDPLDPRRWSVVLEMTVSWEGPGRTGPDAPVVSDMPGTWRGDLIGHGQL